MPNDPRSPGRTGEVAELYLGLIAVLHGASPTATRAALALAIVMSGEYAGLTGDALLAWIDDITASARSAMLKPQQE
jgi:hypothetical protein